MATVTHREGLADTGAGPNTSGSFSPAAGDLLVVFVVASATSLDPAALTSSIGGFTFSQVERATYSTSVNSIYAFVSDALVTDTSAQTVTFTAGGDQPTGTIIFVFSISGVHKFGPTAIRQTAVQDNQAASGTPAPAFAVAALTGNPTLGCVGNNSNPATMTAPTNWTEPASEADLGYNNPTTGGEVVFRDSGFTGTTITWGSTSATVFGALILEVDASPNFYAEWPQPRFDRGIVGY